MTNMNSKPKIYIPAAFFAASACVLLTTGIKQQTLQEKADIGAGMCYDYENTDPKCKNIPAPPVNRCNETNTLDKEISNFEDFLGNDMSSGNQKDKMKFVAGLYLECRDAPQLSVKTLNIPNNSGGKDEKPEFTPEPCTTPLFWYCAKKSFNNQAGKPANVPISFADANAPRMKNLINNLYGPFPCGFWMKFKSQGGEICKTPPKPPKDE